MDPSAAGSGVNTRRVLVVDDDYLVRSALRLWLVGEGYEVLEAPDGVVALEILHDEHMPLIALVDLMMPRMGGFELLSEVARNEAVFERHTFILMTASTSVPAEVSAFLALHSIPLVAKPFKLDILLAHIQKASAGVAPRRHGTQPS